MNTLVCTAPGKFDYVSAAAPTLTQGKAIIKIKRIGICGTDLHAYAGNQPYFSYPRILGHELAAEVVGVEQATGFVPGEKVTIIPYFNCGLCIACRMGKPNCCTHMQVCGVHVDGGMTEYLSVPADSLVHAGSLNYDELALVEPLAIGAHGISRACVHADEFVLVIGAGPIGLGTMEFARMAGSRVIAMDTNEERLSFCSGVLKVPYIVKAAPDADEHLMAITGGDMPTVVIDATGNLNAINNGFQYLSHGGRYVLIGLQKEAITIQHPEFHKREATLMSSRNALRKDFDLVMNAIQNGKLTPSVYITHRAAFDAVKDKFASWTNPATSVIKAMVEL